MFWLQATEVACDFGNPERKIYVLNLLHWIVDQQRRIRLLERHIDELTARNLELAWKLEHKGD